YPRSFIDASLPSACMRFSVSHSFVSCDGDFPDEGAMIANRLLIRFSNSVRNWPSSLGSQKILRKPLRGYEALPTSRGAAHKIRSGWRRPVISRGDFLCRLRCHMHRAKRVVDQL